MLVLRGGTAGPWIKGAAGKAAVVTATVALATAAVEATVEAALVVLGGTFRVFRGAEGLRARFFLGGAGWLCGASWMGGPCAVETLRTGWLWAKELPTFAGKKACDWVAC